MALIKKPVVWLSLSLAIIAVIFVISRTGGDDAPQKATQEEVQTVRVGYLRLLSAAPLYTALREGYFTDEGLNVELRVIKSGPEGNEALAAGNIDVAFSILPSLIVARAQGVPGDLVSIFGASVDGPEILDHRIIVPSGSEISDAKDLKGKKIAVVGWPGRTSDVLELLDYLARNGISQNEVTLVGMGHGDMVGALTSRIVDAAAAAEPYISLGELAGEVKPLPAPFGFYYRLDRETEVTTYLARESWIDNNIDTAQKFVRALEKGRKKSADLNWLVEQGLPTFNARYSPAIDFVEVTKEQARNFHFMPIRRQVSEGGLQHVADQLVRYGPIESAPEDLPSLIKQIDARVDPER